MKVKFFYKTFITIAQKIKIITLNKYRNRNYLKKYKQQI